MSAFPWAEAMRFGFGTLRLGPAEFWGMTPRELAAAIDGVNSRTRRDPPDRNTMARLMAAFPDEESPHGR
jgi:uncharacterized phage protein (TIGR02216 family)